MDPSGMGGDVPADLTRAFCAQVERRLYVVFFNVLLEILQNDAGLCCDDIALFVEVENFVHFFHRNDDLVVDRDAPAHEARVPALRHDGQIMRVAVLHDLRDLFGRLRE